MKSNRVSSQLEFDFEPRRPAMWCQQETAMALSPEVRRLQNKWATNAGWPKRLEYIDISGLRGWHGNRVDFQFPIVAIVGENGSGKSTILQCAASVYNPIKGKGFFPSTFFPDTTWDTIGDVSVKYSIREGGNTKTESIRKLKRWRGYHLRPERHVQYVDLSRVQPIPARTGYMRLANPQLSEGTSEEWAKQGVGRMSHLMGRSYERVRMATTKDSKWKIPVLHMGGNMMSGFHQGAGETTIAELLQVPLIPTALVLIDEIETSLHPRVQRRLVRDLAERCRADDLQIIMSTHSPYVLQELPPEARIYVMNEPSGRTVVTGVSPDFAMTKMDELQYPECDIFTEDARAAELVKAVLYARRQDLFPRCTTIPYGAASVGYALGQMASEKRFPRPSCVFVDGDQQKAVGCTVLPGDDAPERVVFADLAQNNWGELATRIARSHSEVSDACAAAMATSNHHDWIRLVGDRLLIGGDILWHAMCAQWAKSCLTDEAAESIVRPIADAVSAP